MSEDVDVSVEDLPAEEERTEAVEDHAVEQPLMDLGVAPALPTRSLPSGAEIK